MRYHTRQTKKTIPRKRVAFAIFFLLVALSACTVWRESESDAVRRAVIVHELDEPGLQVDELIIRLSPGEFRSGFREGNRIIWLVSPEYQRQYREGEYFKVRDPERSYLFVQDIIYDGAHNQAMVGVVLYLGPGQVTIKEITLHNRNGLWQVTSEKVLEAEAPGR